MDFTNKKVLIIGSGISGIAASQLLHEQGAFPVLFDENMELDKKSIIEKGFPGKEEAIFLGTMQEDLFKEIALAVISPGVSIFSQQVKNLKEQQIPVIGEIELAYGFEKGNVVAITGTNGKTTTTTLVGKMVEDYFAKSFVAGNIGIPYTKTVKNTSADSITVAEISSFQLETIENFKPVVSAILNITPDHLNRHFTMENYVEAKCAITKNQTKEDVCVLNYENEYTRHFGEICPARVVWFSSKNKLEEGLFLKDSWIVLADHEGEKNLLHIKETTLVGICNYENIMAAIGIGLALKIPMESILASVRSFRAVEHRIEYVATKLGVDYYNDSKGTNPDAAIQGILAMTKPTLLIGGGYDKDSEFDTWIEAFQGKVKYLILLGQTAEKIAACARKHGFHEDRHGQ
jgi:UDP-N-acetylmuramoylalanine--D-glutamate ligase